MVRAMAAITSQDFIDYFETHKEGVYECSFCKNQNFVIIKNHSGTPAEGVIYFMPPPGIVQNGYHSYYGILCTKCARADLFYAPSVDQWLRERGKMLPLPPT